MKTLIAILFLSFAATAVFAQKSGVAGFIRIASMDIPDAKSVTPQVIPNITGFRQNFTGIGGELSCKRNKIMADADILLLTQKPVNSGEHYAEQFSGSLLAKTGYVILETKNVYAYPVIGAGIAALLVHTYDKQSGTKEQMHTIYLVQPVFSAGINTDIIIYWFKDRLPSGALPVGIRAGYHFAGISDHWKRLDQPAMKPRPFSVRGWYISIALGMGYYKSSKTSK